MNKQQSSKSKQRLLVLSKILADLISKIIGAKYITKGTIYDQKKKCGNKNCKCSRGELHSTKVLSFSEQGKTHLIPLTKYPILELSTIETQVENYRRFRSNRAKIVNYFKLLIVEINKLEQNLMTELPGKKGEKNWKE